MAEEEQREGRGQTKTRRKGTKKGTKKLRKLRKVTKWIEGKGRTQEREQTNMFIE